MFYSTKCTCDHFTEQECIRKDCIIDMSQYHQQCDGSIISLPLRITSNALEQITFCRNSIIIWWSSWSYEIIWDLWWSYDDHMMIIWWSYEIITKKSIIRGSALWWIIIILSLSENYTPVASLLCSITSSSLQWQSSASWSSPGLKLYLAITETSSIRTNTIISTKIQTVISNVLDCFRLESSSHQDQQDYHQDHQDQQDNQEDHHSETSNVLKTC